MKTIIISNIFKILKLRNTLNKIIDSVLYTHIFIGLCAVSSVLSTKFIILGYNGLILSLEVIFIFSSTVTLYIIHRLIGIKLIKQKRWPSRYKKIQFSEKSNLWLLIINGIISIYCFLNLDIQIMCSLIVPIVISLSYVLPIFKGKRLRDFNYVKIFLIAIVWAWLTVVLPIQYSNFTYSPFLWLLFIEKLLFIFAITIPFDIRDIIIDRKTNLETLSTIFDLKTSKIFAISSLIFALFINAVLFAHYELISLSSLIAYVITYLISGFLIFKSSTEKTDAYFTGMIDGTMILLLSLMLVLN